MTTLEQAKQEILLFLTRVVPESNPTITDLITPPQKEMGDIAFPCFGLAKLMKKNPVEVAKDIVGQFTSHGFLSEARSAGPYVNFLFDRKIFSSAILKEIFDRGEKFGNAETLRKDRIMIEYGSPNTHKEIHVGHLRNFCLGLSVVNLCRAAGFNVAPVSYIGDVGAHVAKCLWAYQKFFSNTPPSENRGKFLGMIYTEATRKVEENPEWKEEISAVQRSLEAQDPEWTKRWQETREWSIDELNAIFAELGIIFDRMYFESEVEEAGKKLVGELLSSGIAEKSQGAIVVNLEKEGLGFFLVLKSDGSALYATKELALAKKKFEEFNVDRSLHVVDMRQSLYFKQFFATLERMGFTKQMTHLAYEFVTLKEGAMSSRKGNVVTYEDFRDEMIHQSEEETRKRHPEWSDQKLHETAWIIAEGAMKFGMLKQDIERPIVFDIDAALSFDGFTGPYIQYAHARLSSILTKAGDISLMKSESSDDVKEYTLLRLMADFPLVARVAAEAYRPSILAQYLFDFAQASNNFYRDVPVLHAEENDRIRRLDIVRASKTVLSCALALLGIRAPEEM